MEPDVLECSIQGAQVWRSDEMVVAEDNIFQLPTTEKVVLRKRAETHVMHINMKHKLLNTMENMERWEQP